MISPWMVYLADLCDDLKYVIGILSFISFGLCLINITLYTMCCVEGDDVTKKETAKNSFYTAMAALILLGMWVLMPSTQTVYMMLITEYITPDNISQLNNVLQSLVSTIKEVR